MEKLKKHGFSIGIIIIICAMLILGICEFYHLERVLCELQRDVNTMNIHSGATTQTEYTQTIDFLENEMAKFRDFVEKQQEFLIWLIGLIGVALTGVFAFFEIKGRKDISNMIQEQYAEQTKRAISSFIGGQENVKYLMSCIAKEELAKKKNILFVFQEKKNENLKKAYGILKRQKYSVSQKTIGNFVKDDEISLWTKKNDIIVYQVEEKDATNESLLFPEICKKCNDKEVYCILYSEQHIDRKLYEPCFYVSNANYGLTVIERLFNLLYSV